MNSSSCVVSVNNVVQNVPGKGTQIGKQANEKKHTERIGADLSWLSCFWSEDFRESDGAEGSYLMT